MKLDKRGCTCFSGFYKWFIYLSENGNHSECLPIPSSHVTLNVRKKVQLNLLNSFIIIVLTNILIVEYAYLFLKIIITCHDNAAVDAAFSRVREPQIPGWTPPYYLTNSCTTKTDVQANQNTGWVRLIRSLSSATFSFELSGFSN